MSAPWARRAVELLRRGLLLEPGALHGRKLWGAHGARSSRSGQMANGVGKILGPLSLAVIAGTGNVVAPQATMDAVLPAFMFLAVCGLATGLAFTFLAPETHGKPIPQDADPAATAGGGAAASQLGTG